MQTLRRTVNGHLLCCFAKHVTYYSDPSYLVHEKCRDDVARQHSQASQEADQVDYYVVLLQEV